MTTNKTIDNDGYLFQKKLALLEARLKQKGINTLKNQTITPRKGNAPCPLSFAQQSLWHLYLLDPESPAYLIPMAIRLRGMLDIATLKLCIQELVQRHESLRTTFLEQAGQPMQVVHPTFAIALPVIDLSALHQEEREQAAQYLTEQERHHPCNLVLGPVFRIFVVRTGLQEHILLLTMHHIVSDGQSNELLLRELSTLYQSFLLGKPSPLSPLPIQYADYALWQRQWLTNEVLEGQMDYWRKQLAGTAPLDLPINYPRPSRQTFHGMVQSILLPTDLHARLITLSQQQDVTLFMLLMAAYQVLLACYTGQTDISVGTAITNRTRVELENLVGFFVNMLVLRADLSGNPTFVELLARMRGTILDAYAHQDIPFEQLVNGLQPERDRSRPPLFQVTFSVRSASATEHSRNENESEKDALLVRGLEVEHIAIKFELSIEVAETSQGLLCHVEYNTDLFEAETIRRLLGHWSRLLEGIVTDPQCRLSELPLLDAAERQRLLSTWNETAMALPQERSLADLVQRQSERSPDAIALHEQESGHSLSYHGLLQRASQLARHLQQRGVQAQEPVALCLPRNISAAIAWLGIWLADGVLLPLDSTAPLARRQSILQQARAQVLLSQPEVWGQEPPEVPQVLWLSQEWQAIEQQTATPPDRAELGVEQMAYIIYTSGSTGQPKGVIVSQRAIINRLCWGIADVQLDAADRVGQVASWSFDIAVWELFGPWLVGARVVLIGSEQIKEGRGLLRGVQQEQISVLHLVPSLLSVLLQEQEVEQCTSLRCLLCGGEAVSTALVERSFARLGVPLHQYYGPSETAISVTGWRAEAGEGKAVNLGRPIGNTQVYVLDDWGHPVPMGVWGEISIAGEQVGWGYVQGAEQTAERFVPDGYSSRAGGRRYRTGDRGRWTAQGELEYGGRRDGQVKLRGHRIELEEIEAVMSGYAGVQACAVQVREERLVGYVVRESREAQEAGWEEGLRAYLRERLPEYEVPGMYVQLEHLPLSQTGKIDRKALPAPQQAVRQEEEEEGGQQGNPIEEMLAQLWGDVLGVERVGREDDFFLLGGHSLLATRLLARIRETLKVEIPIQALFDASTLEEMVQQVERALGAGQPEEELAPVEREGPLPLSFAQQRVWFLHQLDPESAAYLMPAAYRLHGRIEVQALERSFAQLIQRHEILRTTFPIEAGQPVQLVHAYKERNYLLVIDLRALSEERRRQETQHLAGQEGRQLYDIAQGPLLRLYLLMLDTREQVVLVTMHHIISDGWSQGVFMGEVAALYQGQITGQSTSLPALPIQYADYAVWQRNWLQGQVLANHLDYWKRQLAGATALQLPTDRPRSAVQNLQGAGYSFLLPADLSEQVHSLSKQEGVTVFMTLLAAFQILLSRWSGQKDIVVGTDIANRRHRETEGLIGFFVNLLALRTDLSGMPLFRTVLQRVREMVIGAYAYQDLPFEMIAEHLRLERDNGRTPLINVLFVMQNMPRSNKSASEIVVEPLQSEVTTSKFDLALFMREIPQGLNGTFVYSTELFDAHTIATLAKRYEVLLRSILASPDALIDLLDIYTDTDKAEQLAAKQGKYQLRKHNLGSIRGKGINFT